MKNSNLSLEQLVREIDAVNHAWKCASLLFGEPSALATGTRDLKTCLQVRLLRSFAPTQVYLKLDPEAGGEPLYGLLLKYPVAGRTDADHLPIRVARTVFTEAELWKFERR
jgi:hypothetical protein